MPLEVQSLGDKTPEKPPQGSQPDAKSASTAADAAGSQGGSQAQTPAKPEWLPDAHWDTKENRIADSFGEHFNQISTAHAADMERRAKYPKTADEFPAFTISDKLQLPDGLKREDIAVDANAPALKAMRQALFEGQVDPAVGQRLYDIYVEQEVGRAAAINKRVGEEKAKLGPNYVARMEAIGTFLGAQIGKDGADALMKSVFTADAATAFEALIAKMSRQGAASPDGGAREPAKQGISDEEYDRMTPSQRLEYARTSRKAA